MQREALHDFDVVLEGNTHRVRAATARDALAQFERDENLYVVDNDALFQYVIRNIHSSERGNVYKLANGERIYNPIRAGGYALLAYRPALELTGEPSHTRVLVVGIEGNSALTVVAEGREIGVERWVSLDGTDPPDDEGVGYSLEGYGGSLCDYTFSPEGTLEARAALRRAGRSPF
jgi:hypothetical protein